MKRELIALTMAGMLALGTTPAVWAQSADMSAQAEEATRKVKQTLSIGDEYEGFHSEYQENNGNPRWSFFWTGEEGASLTAEATVQGKVLRYYLNLPNEERRYDGSFAPQTPKLSDSQADQIAQEFLNRVLTKGESVSLQDAWQRHNDERIYYSFTIDLNGLPSPLSGQLQLDDRQGRVVSFWRTDSGDYLGGVPSASPQIQAQAGEQTLRGADKLQLEYAAAKQGEKALLRYAPVSQDILVTDAQSGQLLNLTEMQQEAMEKQARTGGNEASADMAAPAGKAEGGGLSQAEQQGIDKLKNVMNVQQLETKLRAMPELALEGFQLEDSAYYYNKDKDLYTCRMNYLKKEGENLYHKNLTVNAQTGALQNLDSYGSKEQEYLEGEASQAKAQAFVSQYFSQQAEQVAPYQGSSAYMGEGTLLVRQHQNIPYPANYYRLTFDRKGVLVSFGSQWDEDAQFDSPEGIVSGQAALESWRKARPVELAYAAAPDVQNDRYDNKLILAYQYGRQAQSVYAVDAKTGEALAEKGAEADKISYTDVSERDQEILALAQLGVGYKSQTFDKKKPLTQAELLSFLVSANGDYYDPQQKDQLDALYATAYDLGMLSRGQRDETAPVTRIQLIKTLLDMSGYGKAAQISGIFTCSFADAADIAAEDYGYAAVAQGLGVVRGDAAGRLSPEAQATREQMAIMFYHFMNRA